MFTANGMDDEAIKNLWSLEALGISNGHDASVDGKLEEELIEEFNRTATFINGAIHVRFPWKKPTPHLGNNKRVAYCRLLEQFQRLSIDQFGRSTLRQSKTTFLQDS